MQISTYVFQLLIWRGDQPRQDGAQRFGLVHAAPVRSIFALGYWPIWVIAADFIRYTRLFYLQTCTRA